MLVEVHRTHPTDTAKPSWGQGSSVPGAAESTPRLRVGLLRTRFLSSLTETMGCWGRVFELVQLRCCLHRSELRSCVVGGTKSPNGVGRERGVCPKPHFTLLNYRGAAPQVMVPYPCQEMPGLGQGLSWSFRILSSRPHEQLPSRSPGGCVQQRGHPGRLLRLLLPTSTSSSCAHPGAPR